ncbi:MAG: hypothetical protein M3P98_01550 [bacterium]|nr:hypothetical protein [bacterium]
MAEFNFEIEGLDKVVKNFRSAPQIAEPVYQKAMEGTQFIFEKNNIQGDPTPFITGKLLTSFRHTVGPLFARYYPTAFYAKWVNDGTKNRTGHHYMEKIKEKSKPAVGDLFKEAADIIAEKIAQS